MKIITTSWDDGFIMDLRLAELLSKYNLEGTFYIPRTNPEHEVMCCDDVVRLSKKFEIGGHTLDHVRLDINDRALIKHQVEGSFLWLSELLGTQPVSFCFPKGKYNKAAVNAVFNTGYKLARTTELLSVNNPRNPILPTTLQVYEHTSFVLLKNLIVRKSWVNLTKWIQFHSLTDLLKLCETYLKHVLTNGGCFHIWGHSWEIENCNLWKKVEEIFKLISNISEFKYLQNKNLVTSIN